jgi:hypothetical protein
MDVQQANITIYTYKFVDNDVQVERIEYAKK